MLIASLEASLGEPISIEETVAGTRRLIPILGGEVTGRLRGKVLPGGADCQTIRRDGVIDLQARYMIELEDGARVFVENSGLRHGPPEAVYFCTSARFECAVGEHDWLTKHIFVGQGIRHPDRVEVRFFQVVQPRGVSSQRGASR